SVLKTPILVVLFTISYNIGEEIPTTLSQFYENIFETVFYRHDNLKGKVNRVRYWNDNRKIYKDIFCCFCFVSQQDNLSSFISDKLVELICLALQYNGQDKSLADKISDELMKITNLIIEDGFNEYKFIHKSIQEFFSASFVKSM